MPPYAQSYQQRKQSLWRVCFVGMLTGVTIVVLATIKSVSATR